MRYGTVWLASSALATLILGLMVLPAVTSVKHVDIFQQFEDGSYDEQQQRQQHGGNATHSGEEVDAVRTEQPSSCVEDVLPTDPLELHDKLEEETEAPQTAVANLAAPDLGGAFAKLSTGFLSPNIVRIGQNVREVLGAVRASIGAYVNDTVAKFEHGRFRMMTAVRAKLDQLNGRIRAYFEREFVEYRDVCLPDESQCMRLLHGEIDRYEQRLRANVDECHDRLAEELARQRELVDAAQRTLDGPFRSIDACLDRDAGFGRSFLACTGSAVSNLAKAATDALQSFTGTMRKLSAAFERRVDKFEQCVVKRRQLLQQSERQLADSVKGCLKKQSAEPEDFF